MKASAVLCFITTVVRSAEIVELHIENFDAALADHDEVLVHFYAPCECNWTLVRFSTMFVAMPDVECLCCREPAV